MEAAKRTLHHHEKIGRKKKPSPISRTAKVVMPLSIPAACCVNAPAGRNQFHSTGFKLTLRHLASRLSLRKIVSQLDHRSFAFYRHHKTCPVVVDSYYLTLTRQVNRMNRLLSLDVYDEGHRRMRRNHCSTSYQKPTDADVLA